MFLGIALSSYAMRTETTDQVLDRRVRELLLLQETAKKVTSILDLEKLLDEIIGRVAEAFGTLSDDATAIVLRRE